MKKAELKNIVKMVASHEYTAERFEKFLDNVVAAHGNGNDLDNEFLAADIGLYMNALSDYFQAVATYADNVADYASAVEKFDDGFLSEGFTESELLGFKCYAYAIAE